MLTMASILRIQAQGYPGPNSNGDVYHFDHFPPASPTLQTFQHLDRRAQELEQRLHRIKKVNWMKEGF